MRPRPSKSRFSGRAAAITVAVAALALAAGSFAFAAIPGADGTIKGCYAKTSGGGGLLGGPSYSKGDVRIVDSAEACKSYETVISWNQKGQPGANGLPGPTGPSGPTANIDALEAQIAALQRELYEVNPPTLKFSFAYFDDLEENFDWTLRGTKLLSGSTVKVTQKGLYVVTGTVQADGSLVAVQALHGQPQCADLPLEASATKAHGGTITAELTLTELPRCVD